LIQQVPNRTVVTFTARVLLFIFKVLPHLCSVCPSFPDLIIVSAWRHLRVRLGFGNNREFLEIPARADFFPFFSLRFFVFPHHARVVLFPYYSLLTGTGNSESSFTYPLVELVHYIICIQKYRVDEEIIYSPHKNKCKLVEPSNKKQPSSSNTYDTLIGVTSSSDGAKSDNQPNTYKTNINTR
jgi:hypothetical protein